MHDSFVSILSSGSSGNSTILMSRGKGLLIDAGLSCRELEKRMSLFGVEPSQIEALVLTHEHTDHVRGARRFSTEHDTPVYGTRGTLALSDLDGANTVMFSHNKAFEVGQFRLTPFRVRHLAADPVAFSISLDSARIGFASDLGSVTQSVVSEMTDADMLFVESNYDEDMLMTGKYPEFLKRAIKSDHGHLSNDDAGRLSSSAATPRTRGIVLVHLSMENNTPERAKEAVEARFTRSKRVPEITVAEHGMALGPFAIS